MKMAPFVAAGLAVLAGCGAGGVNAVRISTDGAMWEVAAPDEAPGAVHAVVPFPSRPGPADLFRMAAGGRTAEPAAGAWFLLVGKLPGGIGRPAPPRLLSGEVAGRKVSLRVSIQILAAYESPIGTWDAFFEVEMPPLPPGRYSVEVIPEYWKAVPGGEGVKAEVRSAGTPLLEGGFRVLPAGRRPEAQ